MSRGPRPFALANAVLAAMVVAIVGTMLVPLPTPLVDLLLAANLSVAIVILLVSLYAGTGLELSAFPTLLLVTTLYRLALNVSTTRLILLQADAGQVVRSFGDFVVQGNYIVGAVVFLIITLVQFVVIARGSERVAEVGARFALDAMPGKQMSIDGEQRSGAITREEATVLRRRLERESQLYGAMDGAMKFVKGDAIAGLVIIGVNLLGGVGIGVGLREMSFADALQVYGVLTIGDGLVSQLPALLIATGAGVVVTRVSAETPDDSLAADLGRQLLGRPRPLLVAGGFLGLLALVPGLPVLPFLALGAALMVAGVVRLRASEERRDAGEAVPADLGEALELQIPEGASTFRRRVLDEVLPELRQRFLSERGVLLPPVRVAASSALDRRYRVLMHGAEVAAGDLEGDAAAQLWGAIEGRAERLVDIDRVQALLDRLSRTHPHVVRETVPAAIGLPALTQVVRRLVAERVPLRPLEGILEAIAVEPGATVATQVERARRSVARQLCARLAGEGAVIPIHTLDPFVEETIRDGVRGKDRRVHLALGAELSADLASAISAADPRVVLVADDIRPFVYELLAPTAITVLGYAELDPEVRVQDLGRIEP